MIKRYSTYTVELEPGWVWLVGAGPGDPGLLTLHAASSLEQADVVVHDALVDPRILGLVGPGVELINVGKRGWKCSPKQSDICDLLVDLAQQDKRVVRLKGGDPFVFGRGGEETQALVKASIPFRIVPGITAGIGGLAYAGIPLTTRETNDAVAFVTGHDESGGVSRRVRWEDLARTVPVIVIYMPMKSLQHIAERMIAGGRDPGEHCAIVSHASTPQQRVLVSTLERCAADAADSDLPNPALFVVGPVVDYRAWVNWFPDNRSPRLSPHSPAKPE
ncbi:MAG: uroporphyrinogen-III C-methyltransferase [Rhodospirillaceae bacterium]|nr:uroporphyrinogen-III C-methyltransferase [Rhodospirillaceae bacterium]